MKTTSLLLAVALFTCAATSQASPAHNGAKTARVNEIHCNEKMPRPARVSVTVPSVDETSLFRSHAELDMVNPG